MNGRRHEDSNQYNKEERALFMAIHENKCDKCGRPMSETRLFAHHSDYSKKPTDALCGHCHKEVHAALDDAKHTEWAMDRFLQFIFKRNRRREARERRAAKAQTQEPA